MFIETWQYPEAPVFTANSWDRWLDDPSPEWTPSIRQESRNKSCLRILLGGFSKKTGQKNQLNQIEIRQTFTGGQILQQYVHILYISISV
jgi:hypothetical protein